MSSFKMKRRREEVGMPRVGMLQFMQSILAPVDACGDCALNREGVRDLSRLVSRFRRSGPSLGLGSGSGSGSGAGSGSGSDLVVGCRSGSGSDLVVGCRSGSGSDLVVGCRSGSGSDLVVGCRSGSGSVVERSVGRSDGVVEWPGRDGIMVAAEGGDSFAVVCAAPGLSTSDARLQMVVDVFDSAVNRGVNALCIHATLESFLTFPTGFVERTCVMQHMFGVGTSSLDALDARSAARVIRSRSKKEVEWSSLGLIVLENVFSASRSALARCCTLIAHLVGRPAVAWGGVQVIASGCPIQSSLPLQFSAKPAEYTFLVDCHEWHSSWFARTYIMPCACADDRVVRMLTRVNAAAAREVCAQVCASESSMCTVNVYAFARSARSKMAQRAGRRVAVGVRLLGVSGSGMVSSWGGGGVWCEGLLRQVCREEDVALRTCVMKALAELGVDGETQMFAEGDAVMYVYGPRRGEVGVVVRCDQGCGIGVRCAGEVVVVDRVVRRVEMGKGLTLEVDYVPLLNVTYTTSRWASTFRVDPSIRVRVDPFGFEKSHVSALALECRFGKQLSYICAPAAEKVYVLSDDLSKACEFFEQHT